MFSAAVPVLLLGTALVAVPIVLHLIMRQQPRQLEFPALRFVRRRHEANRRRLRLRHWLLLLLRCAVIALLAIGLARVRVGATGLGDTEAPIAVAVVIDTSPRMQYRHGNETRLEQAQTTAAWLMGELPAESDIAVLDSQRATATFSVDLGAARQRLERLRPTAISRPLASVASDAVRLLGSSDKSRKELYVFSDLARASWPDTSRDRLQERLAETPGVDIYVIDVGVKQPQDFGLGKLDLSKQVMLQSESLVIQTEVFAQGGGGDVPVELRIFPRSKIPRVDAEGRPEGDLGEPRDRKVVSLAADGSKRVELRVDQLDVGTHQGIVKIGASDGLACDDYRYFTVEVRSARAVLLAAPPPAEDYALFLAEALAPAPLRESGEARFRCDVTSLEELAGRGLESVQQYEAICLLDPTPLADETWKMLAEYARTGRGVAILLGRNAAPIERFSSQAAQVLLPGQFSPLPFNWPDGDLYLRPDNYQHPILAKFEAIQQNTPWDALPVFKYWRLKKLAPGVDVVLPYRHVDRHAALLDRSVGAGRVVTMTTPVSDRIDRSGSEWNWLTINDQSAWPFVMLINETLLYLAGGDAETFGYPPGAMAIVRTGVQGGQPIFLLTTPQGDHVEQVASDAAVVITATNQIGNYRLRQGGEVDGFDRGFSVNLPGESSRMERIEPTELDELFGEDGYRIARGRDEIERTNTEGRVGRELFPIFCVVVAVLLALEHLIASFFYRGNEATEAKEHESLREELAIGA